MENGLTTTLQALRKQQNEVARSRAKTIYAICRSVTPQFYNKQTPDEMEAMVNTIQLVTQNTREEVLSMMCNLAVAAYPSDKSKNAKTFFDINYILGFYNRALDAMHPSGYNVVCSVDKFGGDLCIGWCKADDYDLDNHCAKPNADIWYEER